MMKKLGLLGLILIFFAGCTTEEYYNVVNVQKRYKVNRNQWVQASDEDFGTYFYCQIREPALTNDIFNNGVMMGYLYVVHSGSNVPGLYLLPFDDFFKKNEFQWTEQVSCAFSPGYVTFMLKYDDQTLLDPFYDSYEFEVRFIW